MKIFNVEINGKDAEWFCNLTKEQKYNWILNNTNQSNENVINEFLNKTLDPNKKEYCVECRGKKQKVSIAKIVEDGNISSGNEQTIEAVIEPIETRTVSRSRNKKK
ncbi:hypothetical protein UFOVP299_62 [uncultured Caudovirales phage]|uniref:Uncharacterized protein n=1 Tax=uncultured Caudovirales phage TaxID=2100421 RepID=A0A6J5LRJ5_9CAUD|nr:hypothetical protein UFOVP299_62 [uncultured Caudovirales phage]